MIEQVDHVAIAVRDIDSSLAYYINDLGLTLVGDELLPQVGVRLAYLDAGNVLVQLIQPTSSESIRRFLDERGEGLHHICFAVQNIPAVLQRLTGEEQAQVFLGGRGRRCAFLFRHPNGLITELTETAPYNEQQPASFTLPAGPQRADRPLPGSEVLPETPSLAAGPQRADRPLPGSEMPLEDPTFAAGVQRAARPLPGSGVSPENPSFFSPTAEGGEGSNEV